MSGTTTGPTTRSQNQSGARRSQGPASAQPSAADNGSDSELSHYDPLEEIAQLRQELAQLRASLPPADRPVPTTETPPIGVPHQSTIRQLSEAGSVLTVREKLSERTPNIEVLTNGSNPTFQQWRASIQD